MKFNPPPVCETANLLVWLLLLTLQTIGGLIDGIATIYLPVSLIALLVAQLRRSRPAFDLTILFLGSCLFFYCIGIILWPVSTFSPTEFSSLVIAEFTWEQLDNAAIWIGLSIAITIATMMALQGSSKLHEYPVTSAFLGLEDSRTRGLYRAGIFCIVISLPAVTVESIEQFRFVQDAGYLALFADGIPVSTTSKAFFYLFKIGFGLALAFSQKRIEFLIPAILYLIVATLDSLKGARGALIVPLLFIAWFYISRFNIKVRPLAILRNIAIIIGIFAIMTFQRDSTLEDNSMYHSGVLQFAIDALATQGRSLQITALYQTVADEVARYGNYMVLSNLLIPFIALLHPEIREAAQSMDQVLYSNNLKHILTYVLNDSYYFTGGGTGGVYTIELIEAGVFFYVLLSMGLGWFLAWMPRAMRKPWVRYLSVYFFSAVFYLPRGEFFFNTLIVGKALLLYVLVVSIYNIFRRHLRKPGLRKMAPTGSDTQV